MRPRFLARRGGAILLTLLVVATFTFALTFALPSDAARTIAGPKATEEQYQQVRSELNLDDPVVSQYLRYVADLAVLDLGYSYVQRRPVTEILAERLPNTLLLAAAAISLQLLVGVAVGLLGAFRPNGLFDRISLATSLFLVALPGFWVGVVLLYLFAFQWPILPLGGFDSPAGLVLPAVTLALTGAAWHSRVMRTMAGEYLQSDEVVALRAKGAPPRAIIGKHALRNAMSPVLTMMAIDFGFFLGGAVLIESVFSFPGLGLAAYEAMETGDVPLLMGCVLIGSAFVLVLNLAADVARSRIDPRVRLD